MSDVAHHERQHDDATWPQEIIDKAWEVGLMNSKQPIPLHVVAVDVTTGDELRLSRGPVLDADAPTRQAA